MHTSNLTPDINVGPGRSLSHVQYENQRHIASLDGLRGLAVALVITCHLHEKMWSALSGYVGVIIFFVLSGYLITRLALKEEEDTGRLNVLTFYIRRTFRIFPLYYLVLAIYAGLILGVRVWPDKIAAFSTSLPYYIFYLQEIPFWKHLHDLSPMPPFYHSWSLGIEEKFYLVWPLLMIFVPPMRSTVRIVIVTLAIALCSVQGILSEGTSMYHLDSYGAILMGVLLALALSHATAYAGIVRTIGVLTPIAAAIAVATQLWLMPHTRLKGLSTLYSLAAVILIGHLVTRKGLAERLFASPALAFVGRLSYGIYLIHILCIGVVEHLAKPGHGIAVALLAYAGTFALSVGLAYLLHISVERPLIRVGKQLSTRFNASDADSAITSVRGTDVEADPLSCLPESSSASLSK